MSKLPEMINKHQEEIRQDWLKQMNSSVRRADLMSDEELDSQSRELMSAIATGVKSGDLTNLDGPAWGPGTRHPERHLRVAGQTGF